MFHFSNLLFKQNIEHVFHYMLSYCCEFQKDYYMNKMKINLSNYSLLL